MRVMRKKISCEELGTSSTLSRIGIAHVREDMAWYCFPNLAQL